MFSPDIICSEEFLDMPVSARDLYYQLAIRADDDGFVQPRIIMKMIGSSQDDLKVLLTKRFLLHFDTGVVVIKHWLIHNMIRADRYKETRFSREKELLAIRVNDKAYTECEKIDHKEVIPLLDTPNKPKWLNKRTKAMKESSLPYSFNYKIVQAFWGKLCPMCSIEMREHREPGKKCTPTIQHIIPISKGGKHKLGNIAVICRNCNVSTQDKETGSLNADEVARVWHTIGNQSAPQVRLGKVRLGKVREEDVATATFNQFWEEYPKKELKKKTLEIWKRKKFDTQLKVILDFIGKAKNTDRWQKGYIKQPPAFLNGECWNDDLNSYNDKKVAQLQGLDLRKK